MNRQDLEFHTFSAGKSAHGMITHYPTGKFVNWSIDDKIRSQWRAKEKAIKELEKLVNDENL